MKSRVTRRQFIKTTSFSGAALGTIGLFADPNADAIAPIRRKGTAHFKLSLVGYSFRRYFTEKDSEKKITLFDFVDYCADEGFPAVELTGYYFPKPCPNEYLIELKQHAYLRGVAISGTSMGAKFSQPPGARLREEIASVKAWVDAAAVLGAPYVRVFAAK